MSATHRCKHCLGKIATESILAAPQPAGIRRPDAARARLLVPLDSALSGFAAVGTEGPAVTFGVASGDPVG